MEITFDPHSPDDRSLIRHLLTYHTSPDPEETEHTLADPPTAARAYRESLPNHRALFSFMAANPDRWIQSQELADHFHRSRRQIAGSLGAFSRRVKHRYGGASPFNSVWDPNLERSSYFMPEDIAQAIHDEAHRLET